MHPAGAFTIAADHPSLAGHFPGRPIVPGVVLLDHAAGLILAHCAGRALAGFPAIRFTRPVRPGDTVAVAFEPAGDALYRFQALVGTETVLSGTLACT